MKTRSATDNGNLSVGPLQTNGTFNTLDRGWLTQNIDSNNSTENRTNNSLFNTNYNTIYSSAETTETFLNYSTSIENSDAQLNVEFVVCNRQYRINAQNTVNFNKSFQENNLETTKSLGNPEQRSEESNEFSDDTPIDDDRVFDQSDTDEMSENGVHPVPRGIVNPNYPGFQHLAHTLQDYSSNIENYYHSENDMTDDDADIEITELAFEGEANQNTIDSINVNNNHINKEKHQLPKHETHSKTASFDCKNTQQEIPDLLKTVSQNNNNNEVDLFEYEVHCSDTDIENNFKTKDIIGDFNKEIEDEIKQLLNYNINIQDDLEELRRDIKDSFAKPIENTINNISDVMNHVIKKLVENQNDDIEESADIAPKDEPSNKTNGETVNISNENKNNTRMEVNLSRPTFLYIDSNTNNKIDDAVLSDGKDEINFSAYDTDKLSQNVENTIKQLSTELRKIIPKLDEMRERDRLWAESNRNPVSILMDGNSNEISNTSNNCIKPPQNPEISRNSRHLDIAQATIRQIPTSTKGLSDTKERQKNEPSSRHSTLVSPSNTSVRKTDNSKDFDLGSFDVYNIETALPKLDIDAIENHLKAAKEAERRKRNDREEIRKRLAMGAEADEYYSLGYTDRPGKKPSLHSRLQSGMNLQICFMNETASDNESQASDLDRNVNYNTKSLSRSSLFNRSSYNHNHPYQTRPLSVNITKHDKISTVQSGTKLRPTSLTVKQTKSRSTLSLGHIELKESDFFALQSTLQTEARMALAQAKEMARIQMERERRCRSVSPVTEMLRRSLQKASAPLAADRRRVSRQLLTDMNIAQLQVIVNELHSQIESLNDSLVKLLMARDELHMGQDSMLVDIEDLTRYLGVKEQTKKTKGIAKTGMKRLTSLVNK